LTMVVDILAVPSPHSEFLCGDRALVMQELEAYKLQLDQSG